VRTVGGWLLWCPTVQFSIAEVDLSNATQEFRLVVVVVCLHDLPEGLNDHEKVSNILFEGCNLACGR
jgi:hypothetical protein